jgi:hypothetical protein
MLDSTLALEGEFYLYPVQANPSPDPVALNEVLGDKQKPVRAPLAAHYFGVALDLPSLREWCSDRDIVLIEDCSRVLVNEHFSMWSATTTPTMIEELPGIMPSREGRRPLTLTASGVAAIELRPRFLTATSELPGIDYLTEQSGPSDLFKGALANSESLHQSRFVVDHSSFDDNVQFRYSRTRWSVLLAKSFPTESSQPQGRQTKTDHRFTAYSHQELQEHRHSDCGTIQP